MLNYINGNGEYVPGRLCLMLNQMTEADYDRMAADAMLDIAMCGLERPAVYKTVDDPRRHNQHPFTDRQMDELWLMVRWELRMRDYDRHVQAVEKAADDRFGMAFA